MARVSLMRKREREKEREKERKCEFCLFMFFYFSLIINSHGIPHDIDTFLGLVTAADESNPSRGPLLVHCR